MTTEIIQLQDSVQISKEPKSPKRTQRAWVIVSASALIHAMTLGLLNSMGIFVVELMTSFDAPATESSTLVSAYGLAFTFSALLLNTALDGIFHERALVVIGTTVGSLGFVISFFAVNLETVTICLGLCMGVNAQTLVTACLSLVSKYFRKRLSLALGVVFLGASIGGFIWPVLLRFLFDEFAFQGASLIVGSILLNGYVCAAVMRPVRDKERKKKHNQVSNSVESGTVFVVQSQDNLAFVEDERRTPDRSEFLDNKLEIDSTTKQSEKIIRNGSTEAALTTTSRRTTYRVKGRGNIIKQFIFVPQNGHKQINSEGQSVRKLLLSPLFCFFQLHVYLFYTGVQYAMVFYPAIAKELGFSQYQAAIFLTGTGISGSIGRLLSGFVGDYVSFRKIIVVVSIAVLALSIFLRQLAVSFWPQIICAAGIGVSLTPSFVYRVTLIRDIFDEKAVPLLLSLTMCASGLGITVGGPLFGWLRDSSGGFALPTYVAIAVFIASGAALSATGLLQRISSRKTLYRIDSK